MLGSHIKKEKTFAESIRNTDLKAVQLFTGSTKQYYSKTPSDEDIEETKKLLKEKNTRAYIHSKYLINLSKEEQEKGIESLQKDLLIGHKMGFSGVVVHVGKYLKMGKEEAIENMYKNIKKLNIQDCPLLIETPAGQGTELLTDYKEFLKFLLRFEEKNIGICIDTCHVFAAGHDPLEVIEHIYKNRKDKYILVHYNDSKTEKGSRKDRHAPPGEGHVGKELMLKIKSFCEGKGLDMIIE